MRSVLGGALATLAFAQAIAPAAVAAQSVNVLAPAAAPRAQTSPPSTLPRTASAAAPRATTTRRANVLPAIAAPRAAASPPSAPRALRAGGIAVGTRSAQGLARRSPLAVPRNVLSALAGTPIFNETFAGVASSANGWTHGGDACITAGNAQQTPATSVPACGANAPQDTPGNGALQLTPPLNEQAGYVFATTPLATSNGVSVTFNYYSFNASGTAGDGLAIVLTDASKGLPTAIGGCCGSLGYAPYNVSGRVVGALANGYLGVGLDETGYFSAANEGKTGGLSSLVGNTIAARGAAATNAQYLLGYKNATGAAAALPFALNAPSVTTRPAGLTVNLTLTATGVLSVSIDRHDGNGLVAYIAPTPIVGLNGQPAVPANVYLGFIAAGGGANARHQISSVAAATAPIAPPVVSAESFAGAATTPNGWAYGNDACLTAGSAATPSTSVPACGANAPQDAAGSGALQLTPPINQNAGYVFDRTPFATGAGVSISFNYASFNSSGTPGDGLALVLTDASKALPTAIGGCCGSLGYAPYNGNGRVAGALANGYLGIGLDESGYYTYAGEGKTGGTSGLVPNALTVRGASSANAPYLFGTANAAGTAAALPFSLYRAGTTRPTPFVVNVTLSAGGLLSASIDRQDGNGPVTYVRPTQVVGVAGQPALPANVYIGFIAAGGGADARHQIGNFSVTGAAAAAPKISVLTYHNDINRTGWNAHETTLTTANVNASSFGLLHTVTVDGRVDAQPLIVPGQPIDGAGIHDTVYVATENDTVYAIDASTGAVIVSRNLGVSIPNTSKDYDDNIYPTYGIVGTPVIDPSNNALYLVTDTNEGTNAPDVYRLHKLALNNLSDLVPSAIIAPATTLSDGSAYAFAPQHQRQRPGLLEANGTIYVAFGSTGDTVPAISRGIIAGFSAANLAPLAANQYTDRLREVTNPFYLSAIWQSGYGVAADSAGDIYFSTGNSDPNTPSYGPPYNYPDSVLRVAPNLSSILDSFTQYNYFSQDEADGDLGSGGTLVLPDQPGIYPHLIVAGGKDGRAYVLNRDNLGGFTSGGPNKDLAELASGQCWCGPAYFVGADSVPRIVTGGGNGIATWKLVDTTSFGITLEGRASAANTNGQPDNGGAIPVISSNGTAAGSAIVWFVQKPNDTTSYTLNLRAYDASNLANQIYTATAGNWTNQNSNANVIPTVANGRVYIASNKQLRIFGLLGQ